jgi:hypothetical protein
MSESLSPLEALRRANAEAKAEREKRRDALHQINACAPLAGRGQALDQVWLHGTPDPHTGAMVRYDLAELRELMLAAGELMRDLLGVGRLDELAIASRQSPPQTPTCPPSISNG